MYLLLHYMFLWSHFVQDFVKLKKLWKSSIYDMHLQVLWRSRNKTLLSVFPPTVQRIRCFNLLDENTVFSLAVNVWCVSTSTEPGPPAPLDLSRKTALCLYRHESPQLGQSPQQSSTDPCSEQSGKHHTTDQQWYLGKEWLILYHYGYFRERLGRERIASSFIATLSPSLIHPLNYPNLA